MPVTTAIDPEDRSPVDESAPRGRDQRPGLTPLSLFIVLLIAFIAVKVQLVLVLTLLALLFATVIERPVNELERRRVPRGVSILLVYIIIIGGIALLSFLIAPAISQEAATFREEAPDQLRELENSWSQSRNPLLSGPGEDLLDQAIDALENPSAPRQETAINVLLGVGGGVVGLLTVLVIAFYYLLEKDLLRRLILDQLQPASRTRVARTWDRVEAQVGRWLRGQLTLCLIIGVTATIGYGIIGVRFWPLLGLWAGITEIIPIVGPWLGGIPAFVIALTQGWQTALIVAAFIVTLQMLENTVLVPRVMRGAVGLTPLTVFVAILAGTEFRNVVGAILAIPIAAAVQVIITEYLQSRRATRQAPDTALSGWRWMRGQLEYQEQAPTRGPVTVEPAPDSQPPKRPEVASWAAPLLSRVSRVADRSDGSGRGEPSPDADRPTTGNAPD